MQLRNCKNRSVGNGFIKVFHLSAFIFAQTAENQIIQSRQTSAPTAKHICVVITMDKFELTLNSPITEEQMDAITDIDFDNTSRIWFHTKYGKTVEFVKQKHGKWKFDVVAQYDLSYGGRIYIPEYRCNQCRHYYESYVRWDEPKIPEDADFPKFCENCGAIMDGMDGDSDV